MKLIDEIEAAAKSCTVIEDDEDVLAAFAITTSKYWDRIKAAIIAGDEMADLSMYQDVDEEMQQARARFRAATEGTK